MIYINEEKLNSIRLLNDNFYVIMDYDMTITSADSSNSWNILENINFVNPMLKEDSLRLLNKYYPYELDYSLDNATKSKYMEKWYWENMNLFYKYGLTYDALCSCVKNSNVKFRNGAKDFLHFLYSNNIPVIILSAGIGNVIVEVLKLNDCLYPNICIISNFMDFKDNMVQAFDKEMIHTCNKSIHRLPADFYNKISSKDYVLLFGDLIEDLNMIPKEDASKMLSFGFLEMKVDDNFKFYKDAFDIVLTDVDASFSNVQAILNKISEF